MTLLTLAGESPTRNDERQAEMLLHEPPRNTRYVPEDGPGGFVDGELW